MFHVLPSSTFKNGKVIIYKALVPQFPTWGGITDNYSNPPFRTSTPLPLSNMNGARAQALGYGASL